MRFLRRPRVKLKDPIGGFKDRLVRTCYRENIRDIKEAQLILSNLVQKTITG
jgi:hypothetical protein